MEKIEITNAKYIQQHYADGIAVDFEIKYFKEKGNFLKDEIFNATYRILFTTWALTRWNIKVQSEDMLIKLAFPYVVKSITSRIQDGTLQEYEEEIVSIENTGPHYPYDINKIEKVIGYEFELENQTQVISDRIEQNKVANEIIVLRDNINALIHSKTKESLFKLGQERNILYLFRKVETEEQLTYAIASLTNLITDLNIKLLKKITPEIESNDKSLILLTKFLDSIDNDSNEIIANQRLIYKLRQAFPIHTDKADIVSTFKKLGVEYGDRDYDKIWKILTKKYHDSLKLMIEKIKKYVA